ncbi:acetyl-CoA synthetase-like protein [Dacryopinax primogenitus]|uniref:Acetyl-CoA synthetase-like protein n=1 Tax=Dacryopinax primogenitus (strain DJM 731) TaxID=1858805 RepID=M5FVZ3_DACPD|nr:acetyl-CoA synthetase-like protein [Dacryopinax primogenitus]EJT97531.1 acetyl-CoA synthetase-like protein [Dacryopinax primogenitus]
MAALDIPPGNIHSFLFPTTTSISPSRPRVPEDKPIFDLPSTGEVLTYGRLRSDTLSLAAGLHALLKNAPGHGDLGVSGTSTGPIVLLHFPNSLHYPVVLLGSLAAGCTVTLTNPILTPTEIAHIVGQTEPEVVFTQPGPQGQGVIEAAYEVLAKEGKRVQRANVFTVDIAAYPFTVSRGNMSNGSSWTGLMTHQNEAFVVTRMTSDEARSRTAIILWSSGTTGKSKGVLLSHRALVAHPIVLLAGNPSFKVNGEIWVGFAPFFHIFGLMNVCLFAPYLGAHVLLLPKFDFLTFLRLISTHRVTNLHIVPPIAVALAKSPLINEPWCDLSSAKTATCGGAPCGVEIIEEVRRRTGVVVTMGYGLSETGSVTSTPLAHWDLVEPHLGASGQPVPGMEIKIADESGRALKPGEVGEILCRAPFVMSGYVNNKEATAGALDQDGFVHTGDLGYLDKDNWLFIVDRLKEVIKYKGFQVSPAELDAIIGGLSSIADVGAASIYSDEQGTELPLAYVVPRSPALHSLLRQGAITADHTELINLANEVRKTVEEKCAHYKWLKGGIVFCEAVPRSASGKIVRRNLGEVKGVHVRCYPKEGVRARL